MYIKYQELILQNCVYVELFEIVGENYNFKNNKRKVFDFK